MRVEIGCVEIEKSLLEKHPGLDVLESAFTNVMIRKTSNVLEVFKKSKQEEIRRKTKSPERIKDFPIVRAYRDFYWKVGVDPTKTRPAGEALLRKIVGGRDLPNVNTLVDSYNLASAETMISIAAFDNRKVNRYDLLMRTARKGESFFGIGMTSPKSLEGIEVVIEDRSENKLVAVYPYRDADESKVTEGTRDVLFFMCGVPEITEGDLETAQLATHDYVTKFCR